MPLWNIMMGRRSALPDVAARPAGVDRRQRVPGPAPLARVSSHRSQRRVIVVDQLTLALAPEPDRRRARRRTHPAQPTTAPPPRYRLIPIARLTVVTPEPGTLVAEAGAPDVDARELGYAREPAAVAAVLAPYFAAVRADQEEF